MNAPISEFFLADLEYRAHCATDGPWMAGEAWRCAHAPNECPDDCPDTDRRVSVAQRERNAVGLYTTIADFSTEDGYAAARADAEYVAALSPDVALALVAEVRRLRAALAASEPTEARHAE